MEATHLITQIQDQYKNKLILTGLAAIQYPTVQTHQLTFFNPSGGRQDYQISTYHVFIRRAPKKKIEVNDHLLFIARHIDFYANELDLLMPILGDISLSDLENHDQAWRIFAYLKKNLIKESITPKKTIGRRYIDFGDIESPYTINDKALHIRDALLVPNYLQKIRWTPQTAQLPDRSEVEKTLKESQNYFNLKKVHPLFHRFARYASRLESAASAKIEGYDAQVEVEALSSKMQKRMRTNIALRANLNMDNLHRDLMNLSREPLSLDLILSVQNAIVKDTWKNTSEKIDKTPGILRTFDEVIVDRAAVDRDNVIYIAPKAQDVKNLLHELIDFYYASRNTLHPLDLAAIFKCQLVIIHPFGDGNGRLARWFFLYILVREKFLESVHQAPLSHIFLQEKERYYKEILKVDRPVMQQATCDVDPKTQRYHAHYDNTDIYRKLDYSSWLNYIYFTFTRALNFSIEEHKIFERTQSIFAAFQKKIMKDVSASQQHQIIRAIDISLRHEWGTKTERRLLNNKMTRDQIRALKGLIKEM